MIRVKNFKQSTSSFPSLPSFLYWDKYINVLEWSSFSVKKNMLNWLHVIVITSASYQPNQTILDLRIYKIWNEACSKMSVSYVRYSRTHDTKRKRTYANDMVYMQIFTWTNNKIVPQIVQRNLLSAWLLIWPIEEYFEQWDEPLVLSWNF